MKDIWIGTDFHLRGANDSRHPYHALGQLEKLVETCKSNIGSDDLFIFLGDLCDPEFAKLDELAVIIQSIPCRKIMCRGNHDTMDDGYYMMIGFDDVADIYRYHNILFSHKPIRVAPDEVNVHGHLHTAKMNAHDANHINAYATGEKINPDGTAEHWPSIVLLDDVIDAASVQELRVDDKIQEHLTEKFEKYTSIDHDHYSRIVDITPAIDAIVETVINQPTIDDIVIFCNWMDKTFQYGLSRHGEKIQYKKVNTTGEDYELYWHLASPDQFIRQGGGVCWDYVTYEAYMFKQKFSTVPFKTWYVQFDDEGDCPSHTFLTFTLGGEYYYFENSFRKFAGVYKVGGETDAINFVLTLMSDNPDPALKPGFLLEKCQYGVWSYNALDRKMIGISCARFMNYIYDHGTELKTFKYNKQFSAEKVELMNETTNDPMDEILFPDIDSTKYFLADDDAYEKDAKRAKQQRENTAVAIDEAAMREEPVTESSINEVEEDPVLKKYGLRDVGNTHDVEDEEERIRQRKEQEKQMDDLHKSAKKKREELKKRKQKRLGYLKKARRVKRRKRRIRQLKSLIPGVKNEDINALYENPTPADIDTSILPESVIEPVDTIQFFDRMDEAATKSQKLEPVYVVLMHTGTPMSKVIKGVIHTEFTHSSIAFDSSLRKMYTFSSRRRNPEKLSPLQMGGFTEEDIRDEFFSGRPVHYTVYMVPCFKDQVKLMKKRLQYFLDNDIKFSYDKIGLVQNLVGMDKEAKNQWFCSDFVADILKTGKPNTTYIDSPFRVRPMDFTKMGFAVKVYEGETFDTYDKKAVDRKVKLLLNQKKMAKLANESVLDIPRENLYEDAILNYQLIMMDETALEDFMSYMKSFKVRFDNNGNIIVTRREYDQLDAHFKQSMKMIKTFEEAGNVEGVKDELCKIHYMIQLVNEYYLKPNSRNLREGSKDVRKDMMDLRSVMMNVFKQHLTWVTIQEPNWNFNTYYDGSKYGKDLVLPKKMITTVGRTVITAL